MLNEEKSTRQKLELEITELKKLVAQKSLFKFEHKTSIDSPLHCDKIDMVRKNTVEFDEFCSMLWIFRTGLEDEHAKFFQRILNNDIVPALHFRIDQNVKFYLNFFILFSFSQRTTICCKIGNYGR